MTTGRSGWSKVWSWRYLVLRRASQATAIALLYGSLHWGWTLGGAPVVRGNLSASQVLGTLPLADPFAVLQIVAAGQIPGGDVVIGALVVAGFYAVVGGRSFCSWVCPVNVVTDLAGYLRRSLGVRSLLSLSRQVRYWALGLSLVVSAGTSVAAFEWVSPIGTLQRGLLFGLGTGWLAIGALFLFDLAVTRHGWCGHLCPLGAFYAVLGRVAQIRIAFDRDSCTSCGECATSCPEPQVLDLTRAAEAGMIASGACTNCGRCVPVCPERSLRFALRARAKHQKTTSSTASSEEKPR